MIICTILSERLRDTVKVAIACAYHEIGIEIVNIHKFTKPHRKYYYAIILRCRADIVPLAVNAIADRSPVRGRDKTDEPLWWIWSCSHCWPEFWRFSCATGRL